MAVLADTLRQAEVARASEAEAHEFGRHLNNLLRLLLERGSATIIAHVSRDNYYWRRQNYLQVQIECEETSLRRLTDKSDSQRLLFYRVFKLIDLCGEKLDQARRLTGSGRQNEAAVALIGMYRAVDDLSRLIEDTMRNESVAELERKRVQAELRRMVVYMLYLGVFLNVVIAALMLGYFYRSILSRFQAVSENARLFAAGKELRAPLGGRDEIVSLDRSFRQMALCVAALRENERRLLDGAHAVICSLTSKGIFQEINASCWKHWRIDAAELIGSRVERMLHPGDIERFRSTLAAARQGQAGRGRFCILRASAEAVLEPRHFEWSIRWSDYDKLFFCVVHDVTEQVHLERMKDDFMSMVGHDLRVPILSISILHEMLEHGVYGTLSQTGIRRIEAARETTRQLLKQIEQLLDLKRLERFEISLEKEYCSLEQLFEETSVQTVEFAAGSKTSLDFRSDPAGLVLYADRVKIVQVLVNLITNAVKFAPGTLVSIECYRDQANKFDRFAVKDLGPGIAPELRSRVFEPFQSFAAADTENSGGRGLGLAICRLIVAGHGGEIDFRARVCGGTEFFFTIPNSLPVTGSTAV